MAIFFNSKVKAPKELTKFEKDQIELSKKRHKDTIVKPQVVMGKEFKGVSFIAKPDKIIFKVALFDFISNLGFRCWKDASANNPNDQRVFLLQSIQAPWVERQHQGIISSHIYWKDFFNVIYQPSGRIGAGISAPILIQFIPQVNEDIFDYLPLLSETGIRP